MTRLALPHSALPWPLPRLRLAVAVLVLGGALAGAAILDGHRTLHTHDCTPANPSTLMSCLYNARLEKPGWVDPLALGICLLGLAAAAGVVVGRRLMRLEAAALILCTAVGGAIALSGHRVIGASHSCPRTAGYECFYHPRPGWVLPTMAGLIVLGLAGASGTLIATRRRGT